MDHAVEFFSKAGSLYKTKTKKAFYGNETSAVELFKQIWFSGQKEIAMKLLFWLRDCRGGAGNRSGFRSCLKWLVDTDPKWVDVNKHLIPLYGRYDDLRVLFATSLEDNIAKMWSKEIIKKNVLAAKWADRSDYPLLKYFRKKKILSDIGEFRRLLSSIRKEHIVEFKMCSKNWFQIIFDKIPSVAMARYTKAFLRNAKESFEKYKEKLTNGEAKINASTLFPHDLVRTVTNGGDAKIVDAQFEALPNYMAGSKARIMTIVDTSGSMSSIVGGSTQAWHVSTSLGLYCSDRLGKDNPFYKKFMQFESESKLTDWGKLTFSQAYKGNSSWGCGGIFNGACGGTRIDKALDAILNYAVMFKATNEQIPNMLLIISDMQFHEGSSVNGSKDTVIECCMKKWDEAGYTRPKIVYWNTAGHAGSPDVASSKNVGLVSGFSPSILQAILNAKDFTPVGIMLEKIKKYEIVVPK
jgi:hypothetical protein